MEKSNEQLKKENQALKEQVVQLQAMVKLLQNQLFGKKTEVIEKVIDGQQSLFNDDELERLQESATTITEVIETKTRKVVRHRHAKTTGRRTAFLDRLPQINEEIDLVNKACPHCHQEMKLIGKYLYSREAQLKPAELYCRNLFQTSYKCLDCEEAGKDVIVSSKMPQSLVPHSYFSSSILAKVAEYKFELALPFHRQVKLWQAIGLPIKGKQLATNIIKLSQTYLEPLYEQLKAEMSKEHVIHMDETPFKVIEENKTNSYFWVTRATKEFSHHQLAVFHYRNTRSGQTIGEIVGSAYKGLIMCDGYGGYSDRLYPSANFGSCLVHIRREFVRIVQSLRPNRRNDSKAEQAIALLAPVFHTENQLKYQTSSEKCSERIRRLKPLLDKFYRYINNIEFPQGKLRAAIGNALKLKERVYRIFEDGQLPLTNNPVEQIIRPSTLIRKNSLFAKSIAGAQASAIYYSLTASAKLNHLNIYKYFKYLFDHLPNQNRTGIEAYLPWSKEVQINCHE